MNRYVFVMRSVFKSTLNLDTISDSAKPQKTFHAVNDNGTLAQEVLLNVKILFRLFLITLTSIFADL